MTKLPSDVSLRNGQSLVNYFKSFINYFRFQVKLYPDNPFFQYYIDGSPKYLTYSQVDLITTNMACKLKREFGTPEAIGYINDHGIDFAIFLLSVLKMRFVFFAISSRNSKAALLHLMKEANVQHMVCSPKYESKVNEAISEVFGTNMTVTSRLNYDELSQEPLDPEHAQILDYDFSDSDLSKPAAIIHSSGSTSFPKPIYLSNRYLLNTLRYSEMSTKIRDDAEDFTSEDMILSVLPLFHIAGFSTLFTAINFGSCAILLEKFPPSPDDIIDILAKNKVALLGASPNTYEALKKQVEQTNDLSVFKYIKYAFFGSAPMAKEVGEWYRKNNVNINNSLGMTEFGPFLTSVNNKVKENWLSMTPYDFHDYVVFERVSSDDPDTRHLHIKPGCPALANNVSNAPDGGFDTNDLYREDPRSPGYYFYVGRRDDILVLENGEKVNPIPMERTICTNPLISYAVILGHSRQCSSALVQVNVDYAMSYTPEEVIQSVHESIAQANKDCPSHSVVLREMVKILPFNKALPVTDKGSVKRKLVATEYKETLDKMYDEFLKKNQKQLV